MLLTVDNEELNHLLLNKFLKPAQDGYQLDIFNGVDKLSIELKVSVTASSTKTIDNIEEWIDDWRSAWAGKREKKSMGDRNKCILNMTEFLKNYKYTVNDVYEARDRYIASFNGNYASIRQADYFIKKRDDETRLSISELLSTCQEIEVLKAVDLDSDTGLSIFTDI